MKTQNKSDQLRYMTVRIRTSKNQTTTWTDVGTGFLYCYTKDGNEIPVLVTNKHVVSGSVMIGLTFHVTIDGNNAPLPGPGRTIAFASNQIPILRHPDQNIDLAAIVIGPLIDYAINKEGWCPFIKCLDKTCLPSENMISSFNALEDVLMVGYPTGLADETNNFPIVRRGVTSTPYSVNYRGRHEFLADIHVYGGSSGSPIFVLNEGSWSTSNGIAFGARFALVGVLYAGHIETVSGQIVAEHVPTNLAPVAKVRQFINLGLCIKSSLIEDLAELIPKHQAPLHKEVLDGNLP